MILGTLLLLLSAPARATDPAAPAPAPAPGAPVAAPPCPVRPTTSDLSLALDQAEAAFERRDKATVIAAATTAAGDVLCLQEALTPGVTSRFHRVQGLRDFLSQDQDGARRSFAAAKAIEPAYVLPSTFVPAAHPARVLYDSAPVEVATSEPIPAVRGSVRLDGRYLASRPTDRPTVIQLFDESGAVVHTWLLQPIDPLPALPAPLVATPTPLAAAPTLAVASEAGPMEAPTKRGHGKPLLYGAIGGVVIAGGLYGVAGVIQAQYDGIDPIATNQGRMDGLRSTNHGLIIGSAATVGLAVLAGVCSFAVQW